MLKSCYSLIFFIFTTVETQILVPLDLVIRNAVILV